MSGTLLSVIIPSHNDVYLHKTIRSLLENARGNVEIIPVLDGYTPSKDPKCDPRVKPILRGNNRGMREAINLGVEMSRGRYIMRSDEHCMFGPAYDTTLLQDIEYNWIVVPRRYFLDPIKWEVMQEKGYIDYEKLLIHDNGNGRVKFAAVPWPTRTKEREHILIDKTMAMQGSCWMMSRKWWDEVIVRLESEGYGTLYQDSTEMLFKTWKAGGKLILNKKTWYAHKHRDFNRTHNYPKELSEASWKYALEKHRQEYEEVRKEWRV